MPNSFRQRYRDALRAFTSQPGEAAREAAYRLGREAMVARLGLAELLNLQRELMAETPPMPPLAALDFLSEVAAPLEMELRGYHEANMALQELNRVLESRVEQRTQGLKKAEETLRLRAARQESLAMLGRHALVEQDLLALLGQATRLLRLELGTEFSRALRLEKDPETMLLCSGSGWREGLVGSHSLKLGPGRQADFVLRSTEPLVFEDLGVETRFMPCPLLVEHGALSGIEVRVEGGRGAWGILGVASKSRRAFGADEAAFVSAVANVVSAAVGRKAAEQALKGSEERLFQSQKLEALGRLAGGVAHDFNNLLTVINGTTEMALARPGLDAALREELEDIARAGKRAGTLTRQLLAFSRKERISPQPLDLNRLVPEMEKMLHRLIREDIAWRWQPGADLGLVLADAGQMEQVIMNLVINAGDAMPKGGTLTIATQNLDGPEPLVALSVGDTGSGMDEATRLRLFEPFFTTKEAGRGTGLGLATVYGIVVQAGGQISVESEPGRGSLFRITLPRLEGRGEDALPQAQGPGPGRGGETLLVVEDDELVRRLTRGVLDSSGYKVLEASGAEEALALAADPGRRPQMVVTDLVMPGMGGQELSRRLRQLLPGLKVLFLSGYPMAAVIAQGLLKAGQDFMEKPYTPAGLAAKVREILDRAEAS